MKKPNDLLYDFLNEKMNRVIDTTELVRAFLPEICLTVLTLLLLLVSVTTTDFEKAAARFLAPLELPFQLPEGVRKFFDSFRNEQRDISLPTQLLAAVVILEGTAALCFYNLFYVDPFVTMNGLIAMTCSAQLLKLVIVLSALLVLRLLGYPYLKQNPHYLRDFGPIYNLTVLMFMLLVSTFHLVSLTIALVGASGGVYVLLQTERHTPEGREAGAKYSYLSLISTGLLVLGFGLLYLYSGHLSFLEISNHLHTYHTLFVWLIVTVLVTAFSFKLAVFPGLLWAPEIFHGSPTPVTGFLLVPAKVATAGAFIHLCAGALMPAGQFVSVAVGPLAAISMIWGALGGLVEQKVKRWLAYSSIHTLGFMLMGIAANTLAGYSAAYMFLLVYAMMGLVLILILGNPYDPKTGAACNLADLSINQLVGLRGDLQGSLPLVVALFSLAGIPPMGGFYGKYALLLASVDSGQYYLVIIGLATSLLAAYYYLRIIKVIYFDEPLYSISFRVEFYSAMVTAALTSVLLMFAYYLPAFEYLAVSAILETMFPPIF